jgi:hypothetical protein
MSWVTIARIWQEKVDKEGVRRELVRNGRPLRSSADCLSDDELLAKLRISAWPSTGTGWSGSARARCPP